MNGRPTIKHLKQQAAFIEAAIGLNKLLRFFGTGSKELADMGEQFVAAREELERLSKLPGEFNKSFREDGWIAHDTMDPNVITAALTQMSLNGKQAATSVLIEFYSPPAIEDRLFMLFHAKEFRERRKLIDYAIADHKDGRLYSAVPLLLMAMDGAINDGAGKGLHASNVNVDSWDTVVSMDGSMERLKDIFQKGRRNLCTEVIDLPFRNGILHGMDLGYDNESVAAKCWSHMFVVRDWLLGKATELERKEAYLKETAPVSWSQIMQTHRQTNQLMTAIDAWQPRTIPKDYLELLNQSGECDAALPEASAFQILTFWLKRNFGKMAEYFRLHQDESANARAGRIREQFDKVEFLSFEIISIKDEAPAITNVIARLNCVPSGKALDWTLRLIRVNEEDKPRPAPLKDGSWKIVWIQETNVG